MTFSVGNGDSEIYNLIARIPSGDGGDTALAPKEPNRGSQCRPSGPSHGLNNHVVSNMAAHVLSVKVGAWGGGKSPA
jgi:hypothetical protein